MHVCAVYQKIFAGCDTGFIQTDSELRYVVDSGVPFHVS